MAAPLKILTSETAVLRAHREEIAQDTLWALWRGRWRIIGALIAALLLATIALVVIKPRYTAEAMIQFDFGRDIDEPGAAAKNQPTAVPEAAVLVDSAVRIIRSNATAGAVVAQLGLDGDPRFTREPTLLQGLANIRSALGLQRDAPTPSARELAVAQLMRQVVVTSEPRSYLISITATADDPKQSVMLANAVAIAYLRGRRAQRLSDAQETAEHEMATLSSTYGKRHPAYLRSLATLNRIQADLTALSNGHDVTDEFKLAEGQSLVPADVAAIPSFPNIKLTIGLAVFAGLIAGGWLALRLRRTGVHAARATRPP